MSARAGALMALAALLLCELGLRLGHPVDGTYVVKSREYGWRALPNEDVLEDGIPIHINNYGFRDVDWAPPGAPKDSVLSLIHI